MLTDRPRLTRQSMLSGLFLTLIVSLPFMKPSLAYPIVLTDLLFIGLLLVFAVEVFSGNRVLRWRQDDWVPVAYLASFLPSMLATPDLYSSLVKLTTQFYLIFLALLTAALVDNESMLRRAVLAWLAATVVVAAVGIASLLTFPFAADNALLDYARFHFGTLPPGHYPRLSLTFFNANMACNYLSVSAGLLLIARARSWVSDARFFVLFTAILISALATISPGLGGVVIVLGVWFWLRQRDGQSVIPRLVLAATVAVALAFLVALAVTPIIHPTAPFLIGLAGTELLLAPSVRFMLWSGALYEFARYPIVGKGLGVDATLVRYVDPSGFFQTQTDAHNVFLNIAAQCGLAGLLGLAVLVTYVIRTTRPWRIDNDAGSVRVGIGLSFLGAFAYQGLGGSFEDTRHLWVLLGLLMAASRLSRADGNNHRAAALSPC